MHVKRRRLPNFESCSVALFTSLALGGAAFPARSQQPPTPSVNAAAPFSVGPTRSTAAIPPDQAAAEQLKQAFKRTDANGDGQLSREEAAAWTGLSRSFDQVDRNKDGSISSAEFDEVLR